MRGTRSKQYRKLMHQYGLTFNFREPYQVLVDAEMIKDAARFKMRLGSMLESTLHGTIKPMITQCCIRHLYNEPASPEKDGWIEVAKQAERRRCNHHELPDPLSALECILSVVDPKGSLTNKHRYVVASQDRIIRAKLRDIPGVPLIYISRSVMILEPMASSTKLVQYNEEKEKIRAGLKGRRGGSDTLKRKREDDDDDADNEEGRSAAATTPQGEAQTKRQKKPKGPKGPNPLSMKKSKKAKPNSEGPRTGREDSATKKIAAQEGDSAEPSNNAPGPAHDAAASAPGASKKRIRKRKPGRPDHGTGSDPDDQD